MQRSAKHTMTFLSPLWTKHWVLAVTAVLFLTGCGQVQPPQTASDPVVPTPSISWQPAPDSKPKLPTSDASGLSYRSPTAGSVAERLSLPVTPKMGRVSALVLAPDGTKLYGVNTGEPVIPASVNKVLTSLAAVEVLGPEKRFETRVLVGEGDQIVLTGGGDALLQSVPNPLEPDWASLSELTEKTVAALKESGRNSVTVAVDDTLFAGPSWHPTWLPGYRSVVPPVSALVVDQGRPKLPETPPARNGRQSAKPKPSTPRGLPADPAIQAGEVFATQLRAAGIGVRSPVKHAAAGESAQLLASVSSPTVAQIVDDILLHSDNEAAEALFRLTAVGAGQPGSFAAASKVVTEALEKLEVPTAGVSIQDGSGLSREGRVTVDAIAAALVVAGKSAKHSAITAGLPVGAVSGTVKKRYRSGAASSGRGVVHGKTGTLLGVHSLAGYTLTSTNGPVIYAAIFNDSVDGLAARDWLDQFSAKLTECGCG